MLFMLFSVLVDVANSTDSLEAVNTLDKINFPYRMNTHPERHVSYGSLTGWMVHRL